MEARIYLEWVPAQRLMFTLECWVMVAMRFQENFQKVMASNFRVAMPCTCLRLEMGLVQLTHQCKVLTSLITTENYSSRPMDLNKTRPTWTFRCLLPTKTGMKSSHGEMISLQMSMECS